MEKPRREKRKRNTEHEIRIDRISYSLFIKSRGRDITAVVLIPETFMTS